MFPCRGCVKRRESRRTLLSDAPAMAESF